MPKMAPSEFNIKRNYWQKAGLVIGSIWQHYKGGVYVIDGFGLDTHHGGFLVRYHRVGGPNFDAIAEASVEFYRPPEQWRRYVKGEGGTWTGRFVPYR